jgi:hypothetical protein
MAYQLILTKNCQQHTSNNIYIIVFIDAIIYFKNLYVKLLY